MRNEQASPRLTRQERAIVGALLEGCTSSKGLAERFVVRVCTVSNHLQNIYTKYGVHSRTELVALILRQRAYSMGDANGGHCD